MNKILSLLLALVLAIGCGGPRQRTRLGTEQTETEIAAPAPGAAQYVTAAPEGPGVTGGIEADSVRAAVDGAAHERTVELIGDPRLATLAEWIAERLSPAGDPPPPEVLDFFAWNLGLVEPTPHVMVLGLPDRAQVEEHVRSSVAQFLARQGYTHWGATVIPRSGVWLIVVVLSWRHLELDPIPRVLPSQSPIRVHGRLAEGFQNPTIVVQAPDGAVTRQPAGAGPEFDVRVPTTANGAFQVEVLARGAHGESVLANMPVYVGATPPSTVRLSPQADPDGPAPDVATVRAQLLEALNRTRAESGLPVLAIEPSLDAIALAHSRDMLEHDYVGHVSPTTGSAADRVRAAGVRSGLVLENIGRGYGATEIHRGLLDSPGHRANLVSPDATHVGIGVVAEEENGRTAFLATEVFIRRAQPIDTASAPERLLTEINRGRVARGAPEMRMEANVQQAAQEAAEAFFADPELDQQETTEMATQSLRRFAIAFRRLGAVMAVVSSLEEAQQLEPSLDDTVAVTGIGVAQGDRPDLPPGSIAVVIVLAWER
ncbi:MAG: CAP domain-containing protein [Myxococcota bacterium]|nr:CAP domain-containing protein [Myxococcota bacterium]